MTSGGAGGRGTVVVTGAHSELGRRAVDRLLAATDDRLVGVTSPWADEPPPAHPRLTYLPVDLERPLPAELRDALGAARRVVHFAWIRDPSAARAAERNLAAIGRLVEPMPSPEWFVLVSSVAASPSARSAYGAAKWRATERVSELGGTSLLVGLVVDEPAAGPYAVLAGLVRRLPVSLRFLGAAPSVFPVRGEAVVAAVTTVVGEDVTPGAYAVFERPPVGLGELLAGLEAATPARRLRVRLPAAVLLAGASALKRLRLGPRRRLDQVLTLLYKDDRFLLSLPELPGQRGRDRRALAPAGAP